MISLIFNLLQRPTFLVGLSSIFLFSCSSKIIPETSEVPQKEKELSKEEDHFLTKRSISLENIGPQIKNSLIFREVTELYGLEGEYAVALNAVDLNFDGFTDLVILPTYYSRPKIYLWEKAKKKFILWTQHDPFPNDFKASFLLINDLNKDQIPDLISGVLNQKTEMTKIPLKLFWGKIKEGKIHFLPAEKSLNFPSGPHSSVSLVDYDLDGWIDLFISNWFENKNNQLIPVPDALLKNNKGVFEDVSLLLKGETDKEKNQLYPPLARPTYGASTCDVDQNGWPDILTVSSSGLKNKLWMNLKDPQTGKRYFEDVGAISQYASDANGSYLETGGGRSFFSACTDYNNDSLMDIFLGELSHSYDNDSVDKSSILTGSKKNFPPYFIRTEYVENAPFDVWNQGDRRANWVDYNLDGKVDLLVDNSGFPPDSRLILFEQEENHAFNNVGKSAGIDVVNPTGTIVLDFNQDGAPDFLTSQNNIRGSDIRPRLYLFQNEMKKKGKALKLHLSGKLSNSQGIGAMIILELREKEKKTYQRRWVEYSQGGLPSQNESGVIFGIPFGAQLESVTVRWPYAKKSSSSLSLGTDILEKKYSVKNFLKQNFIEITLCESGEVLLGKMSCYL